MPKILRLPDTRATDAAGADTERVCLGDFLVDPARHTAGGRRVGVQVAPADSVEKLAPHLAGVAYVAIEFPGPGEGRGFTHARLLRQRFGFEGEIRAVGAGVRQDLLFFMVRCGVDAFDLVPGENLEEARRALHRFTLAYQPAVPRPDIAEPRFTAARS